MRLLLVAITFMSSASFAQTLDRPEAPEITFGFENTANDPYQLELSIDQEAQTLVIDFMTTEMKSSGCGLAVKDVDVVHARPFPFERVSRTGFIAFATETPEGTLCTMAFAYHSGQFTLPLSEVINQYYELEIDGYNYGIVTINEDYATISKKVNLLY